MIGMFGGKATENKRRPSAATPTIAVAPSSVDCSPGAQTVAVTGSDLSANITATIGGTNPTNFQLSSDGVSYGAAGASLTLTQVAGVVSATVYIRQTGSVPQSATRTATVTLASTGATSRNVSATYTAGGGL